MKYPAKKLAIPITIIAVVALLGYYVWDYMRNSGPGEGFVNGNGRIEATEIDIAAKLAGRVKEVLVNEGDFVKSGQLLARMQIDTLEAQLNEAKAQHQQAISAEFSAKAEVALRESDKSAAQAVVAQRDSELDAAKRRLNRSSVLSKEGAMTMQELDDDRAQMRSAQAALTASRAQVASAQSAIEAAKAQAKGAASTVKAAEATIARIEADITDSQLTAPRGGRVQFKVAQPGEVLGSGGKVLNMVDLSDVYMTFFLPEEAAGKVAIGTDVRLVLDAAPDFVIPAKVSFVASTAQFTPKTVETQSERQKLMFRVKAQIDPKLLQKNITQVKTGLPGVAWVKLDPKAQWPDNLTVKAK